MAEEDLERSLGLFPTLIGIRGSTGVLALGVRCAAGRALEIRAWNGYA